MESGQGLIYEVPEELKYEERVFGIFSLKQAAIFAVFAIAALACFLQLAFPDYRLRLVLPALIGFSGFVFATVKPVQDAVFARARFVLSPKRLSWLNEDVLERYIKVKDVSGNCVKTRDGRFLSILMVTPVDYGVLSDEQKMALVWGYRGFLNSLDFPVQIVMRTAKVNLREYFSGAKARAAAKMDSQALVELERFEDFVDDHVSKHGVNDRLFYLVIVQQSAADEAKALRELDYKTSVCLEKLSSIGLVARRLDEGSLVSLYASFFGGFVQSGADYLSLLTMLDLADGHFDDLKKAGQKLAARDAFLNLGGTRNAGTIAQKTQG